MVGALNSDRQRCHDLLRLMPQQPHARSYRQGGGGLFESGIRAVFDHGAPKPDVEERSGIPRTELLHPAEEVKRLHEGVLADNGALVTLGFVIRGPDFNAVHANRLRDEGSKILADVGATVAATPEVEAQLNMFDSAEAGEPPIRVAMKHRDAMAGKVLRQRRLELRFRYRMFHPPCLGGRQPSCPPSSEPRPTHVRKNRRGGFLTSPRRIRSLRGIPASATSV